MCILVSPGSVTWSGHRSDCCAPAGHEGRGPCTEKKSSPSLDPPQPGRFILSQPSMKEFHQHSLRVRHIAAFWV